MRSTQKTIVVDIDEPINITVLSDLHFDAEACDQDGAARMLRDRNKLPNHRLILNGDFFNLVLPSDRKRFDQSTLRKKYRNTDDIVGEVVADSADFLSGSTVDVVGHGNHEYSYIHHGGHSDPTAELCRRIGAHHGGYSGKIDYRLNVKYGRTVKTATVQRFLYTHGGWAGKNVLNRLESWANDFEGWTVAICGHAHKSEHRAIAKLRWDRSDKLVDVEKHLLCSGSWYRSYISDGTLAGYEERKTYAPTRLGSSLITMRVRHSATRHKDRPQWWVDYSISA